MPGRNYSSSLSFPYGYQGQEKDAATGLTNFELRQYDPRIGRWYNPDPYGQHHSPYLAMSNNPVSSIDPDGGWDTEGDRDGYNNNLYSFYQHMSYGYNGDAFNHSQFDDNYSHGGPMGGSVNADGSFYSSNEQIYDAHQIYEGKLAALRNKAKNESGLGDLAPQIASFPKTGDQKNGNNYTVGVEVAVGGPSSDRINTGNMYNYIKWKDEYNAKRYGGAGILFNGVPTQDTYINGEMDRSRVWKLYGKNFNDLADFSEKAVIGTFAGVGTVMGGVIVAPYVIIAGETVISGYAEIELQTYMYANAAYNSIIRGTIQRVGSALIKYLPNTALGTKAFQKLFEYLVKNESKTRNIAKDGKKLMELYRNFNRTEKLNH